MISVIAKVPVQPEKKEEALGAVKDLMKHVAKEEGTLYYTLNIDKNAPDTFVFMERYRDMDAFKHHGGTPHFQEFMNKAAGFASGAPEITVLKEIDSI